MYQGVLKGTGAKNKGATRPQQRFLGMPISARWSHTIARCFYKLRVLGSLHPLQVRSAVENIDHARSSQNRHRIGSEHASQRPRSTPGFIGKPAMSQTVVAIAIKMSRRADQCNWIRRRCRGRQESTSWIGSGRVWARSVPLGGSLSRNPSGMDSSDSCSQVVETSKR
jgi:hypothetical protein